MQETDDPFLLTGSPPCEAFSAILRIMKSKRDPEKIQRDRELGLQHLRVAVEAYKRQMQRGRYFLHEHPWTASSWNEDVVKELREDPRVYVVKGPMCRWRMKPKDCAEENVYVRKETGWMTNSPVLAEILRGTCSNSDGKAWHRHVSLIGGGRAHAARVYPPALVKAVLKGIKEQMRQDGELSVSAMQLSGPVPEDDVELNPDWGFWDDVRGGWLDPEGVRKARAEEMQILKDMQVYEKVDHEGQKFLTLKWVDTNKGSDLEPKYRSRLVAREIKARGAVLPAAQLFSAMPPLEGLKVLLSAMVTLRESNNQMPLKIGFWDVTRAHFYGEARRQIFARLPEEDSEPGKVALLRKGWYGTQDASAIWQDDYAKLLTDGGYTTGVSNGAVFYSKELDARALVHGDDFMVLGDQHALDCMDQLLKGKYMCKKMYNLGPEESDDKEAVFLNRKIKLEKDAAGRMVIHYLPDARHVQEILKEMGLQETDKKPNAPAIKKKHEDLERILNPRRLDADQTKRYRSVTMRAAYLGQDRPDIAETVKSLAQGMSKPNEENYADLKRLARYLASTPQAGWMFEEQKDLNKITATVDSDFAGDLASRKSTTGLILRSGRHVVKTSSNLQSTVSLSSGESEYYGMVKAAAAALGLQALMKDWGLEAQIVIESDSSAARSFASRRGLGRLRHVQTRYLWLQERVKLGHVALRAVAGAKNYADVLTKVTAASRLQEVLGRLGFWMSH